MKIYLISIVIIVAIFANYSISQDRQSYIIEINDDLDLSQFLIEGGQFDVERMKEIANSKNKIDQEFCEFIKFTKPITLRKFLRKLPYDVKSLKSKRGTEFSILEYQRLIVMETHTEISADLFRTNKSIKEIVKNVPILVDEWPPNDQYKDLQIQFHSSGYNLNLPQAWEYTDGNSGIKIGILDHGVDYRHTDLGGGFGQGYRIRGGWDWKDNDPDPLPTLTNDVIENHGTPIAGIMGALNNNGVGIIGIAGGWTTTISGCQVFSFRVSSDILDPYGRRTIDAALVCEALIEAATDPSINNGYGYGINVVNCSFGGITPNYWNWGTLFYQSYYNAFVWAFLNDVVVSASRGNEGTSEKRYPASFSNGKVLLSVAGVDNYGSFWSGSSYGDGVSISANWFINYTTKNNYQYGSFSGTSNSAPFVSGSSALIFSKYLERGIEILGDDVQQILKLSAQDAGTVGYDQFYGYGRLDIAKALYLSSDRFNLTHLYTNKNRSIQTVSNPPGGILGLYYPYGLYPVVETRKLTETIEVPEGFSLDSTWVWGNSYSWGLEWGNPSYGIPGATFVSQNGRDFTFCTYIYKLVPIGGGQTFWWPNEPSGMKINISILGKYTQIVAPIISDFTQSPNPICKGSSGYVYVNLSQGNGNLTYDWYSYDQPSYISISEQGNRCLITYLNTDEPIVGDGPTWDFGCIVSNGAGSSSLHYVPVLNSNCSSCPTLAFDVDGEMMDDNPLLIKSPSNPGIDITDYYLAQNPITPIGNQINLRIHEPQTEHTWLDYAEVIITRIKNDELVAVNDEGEIINYKESTAPVTVMLNGETDITDILASMDSIDISLVEGDVLTVMRNSLSPEDDGDGDVVLGGEVPIKDQESITLKVAKQKDGDESIESRDADNPPFGGLFFRPKRSVIAKSLRNVPPGNLEIEINRDLVLDYLAVVRNIRTARTRTLNLLDAVHNQQGDVKNLLGSIDQNYAEILPGESIDFTFQFDNLPSERIAYIIKTVGRYETDTTFAFNKLAKMGDEEIIPRENKLFDNYPNPFNPTTQIKYSVKENGLVTLKVYDILGREISVLANEEKLAGEYTVTFDAGNLSSGIYFYIITAKDFRHTKKMLLIK